MVWHFMQLFPCETICTKCQTLFGEENEKKKQIWKCHLLQDQFPSARKYVLFIHIFLLKKKVY